MKTIFAKTCYVILGFISTSIFCFGIGLFESNRSVFSDVRERLYYDWQDLRYDHAFHIDDDDIRTITCLDSFPNGAARYEVWFDNDVCYDAFIDCKGNGIRCMNINNHIVSASFWYHISKEGIIHFNWMLLWEDLTITVALYVLPIILLIMILL
ncbi:MAG: hypothetical protein MJZ79_04080 [Paludibacteraceae bacterium]|nr:hypothetical protein [Paludibacteraceae bacterium]